MKIMQLSKLQKQLKNDASECRNWK